MNQKYEAFCVAFVNNGDNAAEAYRAAGYKARTQHSAEASASRLLKNAEVNARIAELKAKIRNVSDKKMVMNATAKREMLAGIMNNPNVSVSDRLKACDIDNKMAGEYVTKTQLSGTDGGPIVYNVHWDGDADG